MTDDFELEPGLSFGAWLREQVASACYIERTGWAPERVARVAARLQTGRPASDRLEVVVPWMDLMTAFTAPGRYIYFTRRLLERCRDDECAAFVIAHELAHHDLGHLRAFPHWLSGIAHLKGGQLAVAAVEEIGRRLYGPDRECDADRLALDLCLAAGYDAERCLHFLDIMEQLALDVGDDEIVYGPDPDSDNELSIDAPWLTKLRIWTWQRARGYLPLRDRRAALEQHLEAVRHERST